MTETLVTFDDDAKTWPRSPAQPRLAQAPAVHLPRPASSDGTLRHQQILGCDGGAAALRALHPAATQGLRRRPGSPLPYRANPMTWTAVLIALLFA